MSEYPSPEDNDSDEAPLQVDLYGIKAKGEPVAADESPPESWPEVWERVQRSLMRIASDCPALIADTLSALRNGVRGLGRIPPEFAAWVSRAHREAEAIEEQHQQTGNRRPVEDVIEELEVLLLDFRAKGLAAEIRHLPNGQFAITVVRPEHADAADEVARDRLAGAQPRRLVSGNYDAELSEALARVGVIEPDSTTHKHTAGSPTVASGSGVLSGAAKMEAEGSNK